MQDDETVPDMSELFEQMADRINPNRGRERGREAARPIFSEITISDDDLARRAVEVSMAFSELQQRAFYHENGFFEHIDFQGDMPLLPQLLSPVFGTLVGELAFSLYVCAPSREEGAPLFMDLGAGRAYLDHDIINHLVLGDVRVPDFERQEKMVRERSRFLVTDITRKSLELMREELAPVLDIPKMKDRIRIARLNAMDFDLHGLPTGIVYSNELIDAMPTEPVVKLDGKLYSVRVLPTRDGDGRCVSEILSDTNSYVARNDFRDVVESGSVGQMRFLPLFVPLRYNPDLERTAMELDSLENIDNSNFGGIYPIHTGLDGLFGSIRKSFRHGGVIIIDYHSREEGYHNWNMAVNSFSAYSFGKEDMDFQVDPDQIVEVAARYGMDLQIRGTLGSMLENALPMAIASLGEERFYERWRQANRMPIRDEDLESSCMLSYALISGIGESYTVLAFSF